MFWTKLLKECIYKINRVNIKFRFIFPNINRCTEKNRLFIDFKTQNTYKNRHFHPTSNHHNLKKLKSEAYFSNKISVAEFIRSQRGKQLVKYRGYTYSIHHGLNSGKIRWRCSTHHSLGCNAYLYTCNGIIIAMKNDHRHERVMQNFEQIGTPLMLAKNVKYIFDWIFLLLGVGFLWMIYGSIVFWCFMVIFMYLNRVCIQTRCLKTFSNIFKIFKDFSNNLYV